MSRKTLHVQRAQERLVRVPAPEPPEVRAFLPEGEPQERDPVREAVEGEIPEDHPEEELTTFTPDEPDDEPTP